MTVESELRRLATILHVSGLRSLAMRVRHLAQQVELERVTR